MPLHQLEAVGEFLLERIPDWGCTFKVQLCQSFVAGRLDLGGASSQLAVDKGTQFVGSGIEGMYELPSVVSL